MSEESFLLDTNIFITPYRIYYPFDLAPSFWEQLKNVLESPNVAILDKVLDEINKGSNDDKLTEWINNVNLNIIKQHEHQDIVKAFQSIINYIDQSNYTAEAKNEWMEQGIADPWLIATAIVHHYTIITLETKSNELRKIKIPTIAEHFNIECKDLFYFMRQTNIRL